MTQQLAEAAAARRARAAQPEQQRSDDLLGPSTLTGRVHGVLRRLSGVPARGVDRRHRPPARPGQPVRHQQRGQQPASRRDGRQHLCGSSRWRRSTDDALTLGTLPLRALPLRALPLCALPLCALSLRALPLRALPLCALPLMWLCDVDAAIRGVCRRSPFSTLIPTPRSGRSHCRRSTHTALLRARSRSPCVLGVLPVHSDYVSL